jgi:hypothetical protein
VPWRTQQHLGRACWWWPNSRGPCAAPADVPSASSDPASWASCPYKRTWWRAARDLLKINILRLSSLSLPWGESFEGRSTVFLATMLL